jgi:hypothetical protein
MEYIYESPDKGKTVYRRPFGQLQPKELIPSEEIEVMTVKDQGEVHLSCSKVQIDGHVIRPATEVTCKWCKQELERLGVI